MIATLKEYVVGQATESTMDALWGDVLFPAPNEDTSNAKMASDSTALLKKTATLWERFCEWIKSFFSSAPTQASDDQIKFYLISEIEKYDPNTLYEEVLQKCLQCCIEQQQNVSPEEITNLQSEIKRTITPPPISILSVQTTMLSSDIDGARLCHTRHVQSYVRYAQVIQSQALRFKTTPKHTPSSLQSLDYK